MHHRLVRNMQVRQAMGALSIWLVSAGCALSGAACGKVSTEPGNPPSDPGMEASGDAGGGQGTPLSGPRAAAPAAPDGATPGSPQATPGDGRPGTAVQDAGVRAEAAAADATAGAAAPASTPWKQQPKGTWVNISAPLIKRLSDEGKLPTKRPGGFTPDDRYLLYGPVGGMTCDPGSGDVYLVLMGQNIFKSRDHGDTFTLTNENTGSGELAYQFHVDANGRGRVAFFPFDGPTVVTIDGGATWRKLPSPVRRGWDVGAADWSVPDPQTFMAVEHESGGKRYVSTDGGKTWKMVRTGDQAMSGAGIFDANTLMTSHASGLWLSNDAGATWTNVSNRVAGATWGTNMIVYRGAGYFVTKQGLIVSTDKGRTWQQLGPSVSFERGPWFESEKVIVAAGAGGWHITTDRGLTWKMLAPWPPAPAFAGIGRTACWDPINHIAYAGDSKGVYRLAFE